MKRRWRIAPIWRERFFLVLAGITVGLMFRAVFPPADKSPPNHRKIQLPPAASSASSSPAPQPADSD